MQKPLSTVRARRVLTDISEAKLFRQMSDVISLREKVAQAELEARSVAGGKIVETVGSQSLRQER
jgi:hypothetical protein